MDKGRPGRKNRELVHAIHWVEVMELGKPCHWKNPRQFKKQVPKPSVLAEARRFLKLSIEKIDN